MNKPNLECVDTIKDTKTELKEEILNDITKKWKRNCPKCNCELVYSRKSSLSYAIKNNTICDSCWRIEIPKNGWTKNCPECNTEQKYVNRRSYLISIKRNSMCRECSIKYSKPRNISIWKSDDYKSRVSLNTKKQWLNNKDNILKSIRSKKYRINHSKLIKTRWKNVEYRKKMIEKLNSDEYKQKRRYIKLNILRKKYNGRLFNYNVVACKFINFLNKKYNMNFNHALNSKDGEKEICGYLVDGFDGNKNIVFEYDEPHHYTVRGVLKKEDLYRQKIIINKFKPKEFWRYNEQNKKLIDVISGKEIL